MKVTRYHLSEISYNKTYLFYSRNKHFCFFLSQLIISLQTMSNKTLYLTLEKTKSIIIFLQTQLENVIVIQLQVKIFQI